ncbi:MAG TPA: pyruvate kinase [Actinomycetota bacterium]|nr:pyruvate kinase [Actinomycetota bacterium]
MNIQILCTLGPSSFRPDVIRALDDRGVSLFRINLSHTPLDRVADAIRFVREHSRTAISLDTEGAQVRCGVLAEDVELAEGQVVELTAAEEAGSARRMTLRPASIFDDLRPGATISIDFDGAVLEVVETGEGGARAAVRHPGRVKSNRAVNIDPPPELPPLTEKDFGAIEIGAGMGIVNYALSFAGKAEHVQLLRSLVGEEAHVISKIESRVGVRNMAEIIPASDAVLIDRGDLSREIPLELVPYYQKVIARQANRWSRPVFVATNLLESMVTNRKPTVAEANDIANTLLDGVHGLVLAAETAIGRDPVGSVDMVLRSIKAFERSHLSALLEEDRAPAEVL